MQCTTKWGNGYRRWGVVAHTVAVVGLVMLTVTGHALESTGGWLACSPGLTGLEERRRYQGYWFGRGFSWRAGWACMRGSWMVAAARSEALMGLVGVTGYQEWGWVCVLPWVGWVWKGLGVAWPRVGRRGGYRWVGWLWDEASGVALMWLALSWGHQWLSGEGQYRLCGLIMGSMTTPEVVSRAQVAVDEDEQGVYHVQLSGTFELHVDGAVEFYKRMLVIFLGLLEVPGETRGSRRTRDGRRPLVRQEQLAGWLRVPQPHISLWCKYWLAQDWRGMLSQQWGEVLTEEVRQRVIGCWAQFPWWSAQRVWEHVRVPGGRVTLSQVEQIGRESGWTALRERLGQVYQIGVESFRPRDEWLAEQLLGQVQGLVERLEALGGLTPEVAITLADLKAWGDELDLHPAPARRPLPWVLQVERWLFGHWAWVEDGTVRCIYCGTTDVSRKSRQARLKKYVDEQGEIQTTEVYRYYCHNPACPYQTFTNLPSPLIPYSRWTLDHHLAALQMYEWSHSVYRCASQMLGVSKMTAYHWVSGFGYQLLPVAALFGVVRCSGAVGIDEKYVLVPKNDKPDSDMKRWMYVYFAVDCYTYDLLHIDLYPYNTKESAGAFLLALRAKGYHPRVIVTDMRLDYPDVVAQVFPSAIHHECIYHALQEVDKRFQEVYGSGYAERYPQVKAFHKDIVCIFEARTKRTAQRRYERVLAQRAPLVADTPAAETLFTFLEHHWPRLVNAIESRMIPKTNNTTEQVIRIFNQHYKTFCGFENIETAHLYLGVFEKVYRFTPFSNDAQQRIRGQCPLQLAGYEVHKLPIAHLFRGLALQWPSAAFQELVPNV